MTIPKVAYVIDSCRSLQVSWDKNRRKESAKLVWVSKSQVLRTLPINLNLTFAKFLCVKLPVG